MPLGRPRSRTLAALTRHHRHRYLALRVAIAAGATLGIAAIPLTGLLRLDLWGGHHVLLGRRVDLVTAAKAFAFPFLAVNAGILLLTRFWGRYLCGFACPVGALARAGEALRYAKGPRWLANTALAGASLVLAGIVFVFWVDPRVFLEGSPLARGVAGGFLAILFGALYGTARFLGLSFCRDLCPSGIYFALLGAETTNGVAFAHPENCTDCKLCIRVCPVDLEPRSLEGSPAPPAHGLYPDGLTPHALCLRCGDCIRACEATTGDEAPALRMGPLPPKAQRHTAGAAGLSGPNEG